MSVQVNGTTGVSLVAGIGASTDFDARYAALLGNTANNFSVAAGVAATDSVNVGQAFGIGQTLQAPTRALGTTYTNSTSKSRVVYIDMQSSLSAFTALLTISGIVVYGSSAFSANSGIGSMWIVPPGATYVASGTGGTLTLNTWHEIL
jgi:hypothetical protein